jgi:hypothetical protein
LPNRLQNFISRFAGASRHEVKVFPKGFISICIHVENASEDQEGRTYMDRDQHVVRLAPGTTIRVVQWDRQRYDLLQILRIVRGEG